MDYRDIDKKWILLVIILLFFPLLLRIERLEMILYSIPGLLLALSIHETGHALMAYIFGDKENKGRITLNPIKHIDPIGMMTLLFLGIGWGKPVEVRRSNFRKSKLSFEAIESIISLAGPAFNIILAIILSIIYLKVGSIIQISQVSNILIYAVYINIGLAAFNLIPIPPLDGYGILKPILPKILKEFVDENIQYIQILFFVIILLPGSEHIITIFLKPLMELVNIISLAIIGIF